LLIALLLASCHRARHPSPDQEHGETHLGAFLAGMTSGSKAIFLPPGCLPLLSGKTQARLPSPDQSAEACSFPAAFHALNREYRFDRVFLLPGPFCAPLRDRLLDSPIWVLSEVSSEGYLFTPPGSLPWKAPDAAGAVRLDPDPPGRSLRLIGTAENLIAINRTGEAAALLDLAACSKAHEARRLRALSSLEASCGHWNKALSLCRESLALDRSDRAANLILIRALSECGHHGEALSLAGEINSTKPDAETLFLLARVANAAGDRTGEISALRKLVALARKERQPSGACLLYLGQALARDGQRGEALRALEESESAPELTDGQKRLVRELRDHLAPQKK
jgi:tetratricopeptide (TPR) repeat protein